MTSINNYLRDLSYKYYLKASSSETKKIELSLNGNYGIKQKLRNYFGNSIREIKEFGSYSRDTILPRKYDAQSDVDIMILFDHQKLKYTPETYRNQIQRFAESNYPKSEVYKSFPTVVLELEHIKFDLIPAIEEIFIFKSIKIPDNNNNWMTTDPDGFNAELTQANTKYNSIVKPIIRLLKGWNAKNGYPFESFLFEKKIASLNFWSDDYQKGFFYAIDNMSTSDLNTVNGKQKIESIKNNLSWVKDYLNKENPDQAKLWLHKILPE
jgi:hypothetical protein